MDWLKFDLAATEPRYLHGAPVFKEEQRMPVHAAALTTGCLLGQRQPPSADQVEPA